MWFDLLALRFAARGDLRSPCVVRLATGTFLLCRTNRRAFRDGNDRPSWRYHVRAHSFRTLAVILAWVLIAAAFYQAPEILTVGF
jgi:hypothetical protein